MINKDIEKYELEKDKNKNKAELLEHPQLNEKPQNDHAPTIESTSFEETMLGRKVKAPIWFKIICGFLGYMVGVFINHYLLRTNNEWVWKGTALSGWVLAGTIYNASSRYIKSNRS